MSWMFVLVSKSCLSCSLYLGGQWRVILVLSDWLSLCSWCCDVVVESLLGVSSLGLTGGCWR